MTWRDDAACRGMPAEVFFPDEPGHHSAMYDEARATCARCPVVAECGEYAIQHEAIGFWAGMTGNDRTKVRSQLGIILQTPTVVDQAPCGTKAGYKKHSRRGEACCDACQHAHARDRSSRRGQ